ncbi:hypothetical protein [Burkholderia sp. Ac-20365]|uniref:hypothetical protein n=1 Tax=Burkholderia sp. Ac-20365 TaxID=2703897 RepID=UPI00197BA06A|nr:hypothetical protein [Burkholderia sp. Ac-20365]MBN3767173.1 hypothetical protein [Burkholderia sp. Ac-20365]
MIKTPVNVVFGLAILTICAEIIIVVIFAKENVMLYADGGWFVFALSTGNPWVLKWHYIAARFTTYALTVWPVLKFSQAFSLTPAEIAVVNCVQFYGIQVALTIWAYWLARKVNPRYLVFPVTQTVLFSLQAWGFPSELLLGPGILWVILLLAVRDQGVSALFLTGFAALVFTHELALPTALIAGVFALYLQWRRDNYSARFWLAIILMTATILAFFVVRMIGGGAGSDANAIYVFDPRRVLLSPLLVPLVAGAFLLRFTSKVKWPVLLALSVVGFAIVMAIGLSTPLNFDAPRYSARTLIAIGMLVLTILFVLVVLEKEFDRAGSGEQRQIAANGSFGFAKWLFLCLGLQAGAIGVFTNDWMLSSAAEARLQREASAAPKVTAISDARDGWTPAERDASIRLQMEWSVPYRQLVLTNGQMPPVILYDKTSWYRPSVCLEKDLIFGDDSRFHPDDFAVWTSFTCDQAQPPKVDTMKDRFARKIKHLLG